MEYQYLVIDAFSIRPFRGNPAAVVLMTGDLSDETFQSIAAEFNLDATAFIRPFADGQFGLRWFTPTREIPLCGHATLASAPPYGSGLPRQKMASSGLLQATAGY